MSVALREPHPARIPLDSGLIASRLMGPRIG